MAYIKQTWIDNESPLTAERMNHIEDGISSVEYQVSQVQGGTPKAVTQASEMTDTSLIYLYMGNEEGYESGHFYYFDGTQWQDGGQYGSSVSGISDNARNLLKYVLERVVYTETGMQIYVDALYEALKQMNTQPAETYQILNTLVNVTNSNSATSIASESAYSATLSIESGYTWGTVTITMGGVDITSTAYNSSTHVISIASVTGDLVITASATAPVTTYTITNALSNVTNSNASASIQSGSAYSATLTPDTGYNIYSVTITMGGVDVTSTVYSNGEINIASVTGDIVITAVASSEKGILLYNWDFTQGLTDSISGKVATLSCAEASTMPTQNSNGVTFDAVSQTLQLGNIYAPNRTIEIDVESFVFGGVTTENMRFLMIGLTNSASLESGVVMKMKSANYGWSTYANSAWSSTFFASGKDTSTINMISGKTVGFEFDEVGYASMFLDGEQIGQKSTQPFRVGGPYTIIGNNATASGGGQFYNATITGCRVYDLSGPKKSWVNNQMTLTYDLFGQGGLTNTYTYLNSRTDRVAYFGLDVDVSEDYTYTITYETTLQVTTNIGVQYLNSSAVAAVEANQDIASGLTDLGWKSSGFVFDTSTYPTARALWFVFKGTSTVKPENFPSITITRTAVS